MGGTAADATPLERALVALARASVEAPARLGPRDLAPVRAEVGDGALDYALVLGAFHFINRMADLLGVAPEAVPAPLRRFEPVRRAAVRVTSRLVRRMDLRNRPDRDGWDARVAAVAPFLGAVPIAALEPLRPRPKLLEALALALAERERTTLDRTTLVRVHRVVEAALPRDADEARGLHARPADPVEAFAFVGTRYPARTTREMVERLRAAGFDDVGLLDLATAVADANQWARLHRLLGLPPALYSVGAGELR